MLKEDLQEVRSAAVKRQGEADVTRGVPSLESRDKQPNGSSVFWVALKKFLLLLSLFFFSHQKFPNQKNKNTK